MPIIEARQLTRRFRVPVKAPGFAGAVRHLVRPRFEEKVAVDAIDLSIEAGESVAYVGPNGAGKSTTLKMFSGVLVPSAGEMRVRGLVPHRQRIENNRSIGVVWGQRSQLWWDLPVQESLRLLGDIYDVPRARFEQSLCMLVDLLDLGPLLATPTRLLSLGQRMRCDLAAALIHTPAIVYLDEPTVGLDVAVKARIRQFIKHSNREHGLTVLLTSHDLGDIEDICERMVMIDHGKIVFDGPFSLIKRRFGRNRSLHIMVRELPDDVENLVRQTLANLPPVWSATWDAYQLSVQFDGTQVTAGAIAGPLLAALPVDDLRIEETSAESIIRQLYEGTLRLEEA